MGRPIDDSQMVHAYDTRSHHLCIWNMHRQLWPRENVEKSRKKRFTPKGVGFKTFYLTKRSIDNVVIERNWVFHAIMGAKPTKSICIFKLFQALYCRFVTMCISFLCSRPSPDHTPALPSVDPGPVRVSSPILTASQCVRAYDESLRVCVWLCLFSAQATTLFSRSAVVDLRSLLFVCLQISFSTSRASLIFMLLLLFPDHCLPMIGLLMSVSNDLSCACVRWIDWKANL